MAKTIMEETGKIYLLRGMSLGSRITYCNIDWERIFISKTQALAFAESFFERSRRDHPAYRYELLTFPIGASEAFYEQEVYGISGRLLSRYIYNENGSTIEVFSEFESFSAESGDLVIMVGNLENPYSSLTYETLGVVLDKDNTNDGVEYTIYYLNDAGMWGHTHLLHPGIRQIVKTPVELSEKVLALSAEFFLDWQNGSNVSELMRHYLSGDIPWFNVPELISLGLEK